MELSINDKTAYAATGNRDISPGLESVIFIHGAGQNHTIWTLPTRYFARKGFNVLSVDLPGHGRSDGPALSSIEDMSDWISELIDSVGVERSAVVGHSMGSLVALATAARHPQQVRALAMIGTAVPMRVSTPLLSAAEQNDHVALEMLTQWGHSASAQLGGNPNPGMWMLGVGMRLLEQADDGVVYRDLKSCNEYDLGIEHASKIRCPAMLILGQRDIMTPVRATRELLDALPNAEQVVLPGAGHALLSEKPDPVLDALIRIVSCN